MKTFSKQDRPAPWKQGAAGPKTGIWRKDFHKSPHRGHSGSGAGFGGQAVTLHPATCSQCGNRCEVPFKPNGKKPIFCRDCFKKEDRPEPKRFGGSDRPSYGGRPSFDRPSFDRSSDRPSFAKRGSEGSDEKMSIIIAKLDAILEALADRS